MAKSKSCSDNQCVVENPQSLKNFQKDAGNPDGLQYHCKSCSHRRRLEEYALNKEVIKERQREYNKRCAKQKSLSNKLWREKNKGYQNRYYALNAKKISEYQKTCRLNKKDAK